METETRDQIEELISENKVMLFMKGYKDEPMCGFSAKVIEILNSLGVEYETFNVLDDMDVREGIKEFGNWPTIPQLYYKRDLIGGCDIIMELAENGELGKELGLE